MIPAPFEYEVADSVDGAIELLGSDGEPKLLAGGHSLLPLMRLRLARPSLLVDIGRLSDLSYIREDGDRIAIGALTRYHDIHHSPMLEQHNPLVAHAAGLVGDPQVRHVGTIGGSAAHGDPASDMPTVLVTLEADLVTQGPDGTRTVGAADFFTGLFETALGPQEVLTEIRVPKLPTGTGWSYQRFSRRLLDWAMVGAAAVVDRSNGTITGARIGLTNMGSTPVRARAVEGALSGSGPDAVVAAADQAPEGTSPPTDTNATADFRQHLATVLVRRAVEEALER
jgi:aerobic carbon-monoxide dehydrogenase medium subunit